MRLLSCFLSGYTSRKAGYAVPADLPPCACSRGAVILAGPDTPYGDLLSYGKRVLKFKFVSFTGNAN